MNPAMDPFDFWYAVNNTEVIRSPEKRLETFGTTMVNYCLVAELMDDPSRIRVREGRIEAARPAILTPRDMGSAQLEGFGEGAAAEYVNWLREHAADLRILQYGFKVSKSGGNEFIVTDSLPAVLDRVKADQARRDDPATAILSGVDSPWEVCLLKLMVDLVEKSVPHNVAQLKGRNLLPLTAEERRERLDQAFLAASRDPARIPELFAFLQSTGAFSQNEDRFYALVRTARQRGQIPG
jgi:hypothetical protein